MSKSKLNIKWNDFHTLIFDFDGVFTNNKVYLDENGKESIICDRADGLAFDMLRKFQKKYYWDIEYFILSKESNPVVRQRADKLKIQVFNGISHKEIFIKNYLLKRFGNFDQSKKGVLYLGNDLNDLSAVRLSGFSIAPSDAHKLIRENVDLILSRKGGEGFVRQVIEKIMNIDNMSIEEIQELV